MWSHKIAALLAAFPLTLLAACEGGGGGLASAPAPAPPPSSTPSPSAPSPAATPAPVVIFANPTPQTYASVSVSTTSAGDGYSPVAADAKITDASFAAAQQPSIRYTAEGYYQLQLPGGVYSRLIHYAGLVDPKSDNTFLQPANVTQNRGSFTIRRARDLGFTYSELAAWTDAASNRTGYIAFGTPTNPSAIPTTGTATYTGKAEGIVDVTYFDTLYGANYFTDIFGETTLTVDFARASLTGALALNLPAGMQPRSVGTYATLAMPLTAGSNAFSGQFNTSLAGFNQFSGQFTGPSAQEAIGAWALPLMIDGTAHQAIGAWIARQTF